MNIVFQHIAQTGVVNSTSCLLNCIKMTETTVPEASLSLIEGEEVTSSEIVMICVIHVMRDSQWLIEEDAVQMMNSSGVREQLSHSSVIDTQPLNSVLEEETCRVKSYMTLTSSTMITLA